jgi:hypothetical protein
VKLVERKNDLWVYSVSDEERSFFLDMLALYPQVPDAHHRLSKGVDSDAWVEQQRLLEEAMKDYRLENKRILQELLTGEDRFKKMEDGFLLEFSSEQREILLQLLNDIRVGFWLQLGSPEEEDKIRLCQDPQNISKLMAMEFCAGFQMLLISGK